MIKYSIEGDLMESSVPKAIGNYALGYIKDLSIYPIYIGRSDNELCAEILYCYLPFTLNTDC